MDDFVSSLFSVFPLLLKLFCIFLGVYLVFRFLGFVIRRFLDKVC